MARQEVDIGVEGNDGTGDSIRESFRKVNENFQEIYAVVGKGGQITFTLLGDTPDSLDPYQGDNQFAYLPIVKQDGTGIEIRRLASNEDDPNSSALNTIDIKVSEDGLIILSTDNIQLIQDSAPVLGGPLNANTVAIANIGTEQQDVEGINATHGTSFTVDDLVIDKKFADKRYLPRQLPGEELLVGDEPVNAEAFTKTFELQNGYMFVANHGLSRGSDGAGYIISTNTNGLNWNFTQEDPTTGDDINYTSVDVDDDGDPVIVFDEGGTQITTTVPLTNGQQIYVAVVDQNRLGMYLTKEHATLADSVEREKRRLKLTAVVPDGTASDVDPFFRIIDDGYDATLEGFFLRQQVMPRESVVRRQGDTMEGPLYLHDHPGDLAGAGTPNGLSDLQAVSRLYVDSQSTESSANIFVSSVGDDDQSLAPRGKQGSSLAYAYSSIAAACRRAEELNISSGFEPGPYMQDIIIRQPQEDGTDTITLSQVAATDFLGVMGSRENAKSLVEINQDFIIAETLEWMRQRIAGSETTNLQSVQVNWTSRVIDERALELKLIRNLKAAILDHVAGVNATTLSYRMGVEYFKDEYELSQLGLEKDVWITLLDRMRTITSSVLANPQVVLATALVQGTLYRINDLATTDQDAWNTAAGTTDVVYSVGDEFTAAASTTGDGTVYEVGDLFDNQQDIFRQVGSTLVPLVDSGDQASIAGDNGALQEQIDILIGGVFTANPPFAGDRYELEFTNGTRDFVDQGDPENRDLRVGKVIRGKTSGALGKIIKYTQGGDGGANDSVELELLEPTEFQEGENLEFGNLVAARQITVRIETGTYYEDYPIRVPAQTSLVGDEFRRVLIRPKTTVSKSVWAGTYFYRDRVFDGLTGSSDSVTGIGDPNLPTDGTPYYDPLLDLTPGVDEPTGYFGRHYLVDPNRRKDVYNGGLLQIDNPGNFTNAATLVEKNRAFIIDETIAFIREQAEGNVALTPPNNPNPDYLIITQGGVVPSATIARYKTALGRTIDAIAADLRAGGDDKLLDEQGEIYFDITQKYPGERIIYNQMLAYIRVMLLEGVLNSTAFVRSTAIDEFVGAGSAQQYFNASLAEGANSVLTTSQGGNDPLITDIVELLQFPVTEDSSYNPAKRSSDVDVFLMNDATILRNMSVQGHGGFMCTLDPEGQILTKSPYIQTGSSFSQSLNRQAFRGGMLVDAFNANTPLEVTAINDVGDIQELTVRGEELSGLSERKPQTPAPFYINGTRFQINDIVDYDAGGDGVRPTATLILDKSTSGLKNAQGEYIGWDTSVLPLATYKDITLQTAGNRSQLGNDFTQINDLGYGLVTINGGLSEMVSMFTYYCWTGYYAGNGGQIRSLNGSTCNGQYGLASVGSDPNEVPDDVILKGDMVQPGETFSAQYVITPSAPLSVTAGQTLTGSTGDGSGTVAYTSANAQKIYLEDVTGTYNVGSDIILDSVTQSATFADIDTTGYQNLTTQLSMHVYNLEFIPNNKGEIDYYHDDPRVDDLGNPLAALNTIARYELANVQRMQGVVLDGYDLNFDDAADKLGADDTVSVGGVTYTQVGTNTLTGEPGYAIYQARAQNVAVDGAAVPQNDESYPFVQNSHAQVAIGKVQRDGGKYTVSILNDEAGDHYKEGDQIYVLGGYLGGTDGVNDATITIDEVAVPIERSVNNLETGTIRRISISGTPAITANTPLIDGQVYKLNFSTSNDEFDNDGLLYTIPKDKPVSIRNNQTHLFAEANDVNNLTIRPSTAVNFQDDPKDTYRSISFGKATAAGDGLEFDETLTGFDATYDYVRMIVADESITRYRDPSTDTIYTGTASAPVSSPIIGAVWYDTNVNDLKVWDGGSWVAQSVGPFEQLGANAGESTIAIDILPEYNDIWRLNNNLDTTNTYRPQFFNSEGAIVVDAEGDTLNFTAELPKVISWRGKKHYVYNYREFAVQPEGDYTATNIFGEVNNFAVVDLKEISEVKLTLDGQGEWNRLAQQGAQLRNAIVRQQNNTGANGRVKYSGLNADEIALYDWSGVDFDNLHALEISYDEGGSYTVLEDVTTGNDLIPTNQETRETNLTSQTGDGIAQPLVTGANQSIVLRAGLQDGSPAKITINISTCRATGHDMLDVGTGSFNQTNYPNVLLGFPAQEANQANEVQERTKGRVFYVTTDQDGFFRVGRFFTVDQGTGTVTFAASIALSDVDGIGFKRGVVVTEFSTDTAMSDNAIDTVPTESAVRGYVNRRLGFDQTGAPVTNSIGPKILAQNGSVPLTGNLDANGNTITNIANINLSDSDGGVAVNRDYVDGKSEYFNKFINLRDTAVYTPETGHFLGYTGAKLILLDSDNVDAAQYVPGAVLRSPDTGDVFGVIVGVQAYYDRTFGDTTQITYVTGPGADDEFNGGNPVERFSDNAGSGAVDVDNNFVGVPIAVASSATVTTTFADKTNTPTYTVTNVGAATASSSVINGPFDEIINVQEEPFVDDGSGGTEPVSDIALNIRRTETTDADPNVPDTPTAYYNLQINDEVIVNQDVAPDAGILQSKLAMERAPTFDEANAASGWGGTNVTSAVEQSNFGLASFSDLNFEVETFDFDSDGNTPNTPTGRVRIKANGVALAEIETLASETVIGNSTNADATATEVGFTTVVDQGGGLLHTDLVGVNYDLSPDPNAPAFDNLTSTGAVVRTGGEASGGTDGENNGATYQVVNVTISGQENSIVKTDANGQIVASNAGYKLGDNNVIKATTVNQVETTTFSNGSGGTILTSSGSGSPDVNIPGNVNVGGLTDPGPAVFDQSTLQAAQTSPGKFLASNWMYTNFIESANEKGAATSGIALGTGSGKAEQGNVAIVVGVYDAQTPANNTTRTVAKFTATEIAPASAGALNGVINLGSATENFGTVFCKDIDASSGATFDGNVTLTGGDLLIRTGATQKFKVTASNGNTDIEGTMNIKGATTLQSTLQVGGSITHNLGANGADLGDSTNTWGTVYGTTFTGTAAQAKYADLAENYVADADYEPGTVVVFGGDAEVTVTNTKADHRVAGVVSTAPAYLMNSHQEGEHVAAVALTGRVPCKVVGPVAKGDILVASAVPGYAIVDNNPKHGTIIGKSLENNADNVKGIVEIVVGR